MADGIELGKAYVQIIPSAEGIKAALTDIFGEETDGLGRQTGQNIGSELVGTLKKVIAAAGIGAALKAAVSSGGEFETALAKVSTIADTSKLSVGELNKQILSTSGSMGIAAKDIAEAAYQAISAGQDTSNAVSFAGQAAKLAAAGFTSSSSAVDILTTALNAYGLGADQATHVSDVLLTTQNLGKTSVDELSASMGKVIPLAAAYGVSVENLSSGLAVMTANGIATAEATTYTKSMLNELGDTGSAVGKILQTQTGQSFAQLSANGASLGDVLQILYDSVGDDGTAFAGLWSSVEAGTGALSLVSGGVDKFNGVLNQMVNSTGATETAYSTMTDTFEHKLESIQTSAQDFGISFYQSISGPLTDAAGLVAESMQTITESFQSDGFDGLLQGVSDVFLNLATEVAPQVIDTGISLVSQLGEGLVEGIPDLLEQALPVVADLAAGLRENAGQIVDAGIEFILNLAQGLMDGLPSLIEYLPGIVSDIAGIINDNAPKLLAAGVELIVTLGKGLIQAIPTLVANIPQICKAIFDTFAAFNWISLGTNLMTGIANGVKSMGTNLLNAFKGGFSSALKWIRTLPSQAVQWGKNLIQNFIHGITGKGTVVAISSAVANAADNAMQEAAKTSSKSDVSWSLSDEVADKAEVNALVMKDAAKTTASTMAAASSSAAKAANNVATAASKSSKSTATAAKKAAATVVSSVKSSSTEWENGVKTIAETTNEVLSDGTKQVKQTITETKDEIVNGALQTVETVKTIAADGTETVAQTIKESSASTFSGLWKELKAEADKGVLGTFDELYSSVKKKDWAGIGKWLASTLYNGLDADKKLRIQNFALDLVQQLNGELGNIMGQVSETAWSLGGEIVTGITSGFGDIITQTTLLGNTLHETFVGLKGPLSAAAQAISAGLSGGLLSSLPTIFAGFASMIGTVGAAVEAMLTAISASLSASVVGIPAGVVVAAAAVALGVAIAAICAKLGSSKPSASTPSSGTPSGGSHGSTGGSSGSTGSSTKVSDAVFDTGALLWNYEKDSVEPTRKPRPSVEVNQYIYSKAQTAADLMREAQYEQERAVLQGV